MARIKIDKDESRKDVILNAAASLFREKGFKAASMRDLADKVGVEAASLYNHIRSKTELLHDICFSVANYYVDVMNDVETSAGVSAIQKMETLLRFHIRQMIENFEEVYVMEHEWRHLADPYLGNFQNQRRSYRRRFAALIEEGIRNGEIRPIDAPTAVIVMLHAINGIASWQRSKQKISAQELEDNMVTILINGLRNDK
jgi:TetR/AcrR family transcriptional regulator, cholesterol catabolism regulator